jgi:dihydrodipicolinate synthase/N-acetylneuraminate lyase
MALHHSDLPAEVSGLLRQGTVIPAHPLALDASRKLDVRRQRALTRYYVEAGAGGLAVGVHATQFAIREQGLYEPVLKLARRSAEEALAASGKARPLVMIAGLSGPTAQAISEARVAIANGYHCGMLSLAAMRGASVDELISHCEAVAAEIPLVGFYLQTAVGGIDLPASFWRRFAAIENVVAIKVAPFNRYRTLDVARGIALARAEHRVTLYTGNDDHIVLDLLAPLAVRRPRDDGSIEEVRLQVCGGLLGHWSVWTRAAVTLFERIQLARHKSVIDPDLLALDARVTDCNAAVFDVANGFAGCIAGCHEILRRQGLLQGTWCLDPAEGLSPGQAEELDRVCREHPDLTDDEFVRAGLERWLAD